MREAEQKLHSAAGISVWIVALLAGVLVMLALVAAPSVQKYRERADKTACDVAVSEARQKIDAAATINGGRLTDEEAKYAAVRNIKGWDELCPAGGDCYVLTDDAGGYRVVCALHTEDLKLKTRLNAARALEELRAVAEKELLIRGAIPDAPVLTINSRELAAARVDKDPTIKRGTRSTPGYDGTVALFRTEGEKIVLLCYADENYCAIWRAESGWSGDSFA